MRYLTPIEAIELTGTGSLYDLHDPISNGSHISSYQPVDGGLCRSNADCGFGTCVVSEGGGVVGNCVNNIQYSGYSDESDFLDFLKTKKRKHCESQGLIKGTASYQQCVEQFKAEKKGEYDPQFEKAMAMLSQPTPQVEDKSGRTVVLIGGVIAVVIVIVIAYMLVKQKTA